MPIKKRPLHSRDWHERRLEAARYQDRPEVSGARVAVPQKKTSPLRNKTAAVGLANEVRPGLGTRHKTTKKRAQPTQTPSASAAAKPKAKRTDKKAKATPHDHDPLGRDAPLPPAKPRKQPREEPSDSFAREQERDTGVSGHAGGD